MQSLGLILRESSARHKQLCPRQVLGARMSLLAGEILELEQPRADKRLLVIAETDGCTVDGIIAATGCHVGGRTLRILDFGKVAATFVDPHTEESIRIVPRTEPCLLSRDYAPAACNDGRQKRLTPKYMEKTLSHVRAFFDWTRLHERCFQSIAESCMLRKGIMIVLPSTE